MKLNNNVILITGGASGIGFEMAKRFVALGNQVIITGRNAQKLAEAKGRLNDGVTTIQSDVSDPAAILELRDRIAADYPEMNLLINNAGIMRQVDLQKHDLSTDELVKELDINLRGPILMTDAFLRGLKEKQNSAIVNVSSGLAYVPLPISGVYSATKAALHSYTLSLRAQLGNTSVQVFELAPPATRTELLGDLDEANMAGITLMSVEDLVEAFLKGLAKNTLEIRPGQSGQLYFMNRLFPGFILKQLSKTVSRLPSWSGR